jgi:hypothetical protein
MGRGKPSHFGEKLPHIAYIINQKKNGAIDLFKKEISSPGIIIFGNYSN